MDSGAYGLLGVMVGAAITQGKDWWTRRTRRGTFRAALLAEADLCHGLCTAYLRDPVQAPLYRLPTVAYERCFPALLEDAAVGSEEAKAVLNFYVLVEQLNRGLDQAHDALSLVREARPGHLGDYGLDEEAGRLRLKAATMTSPDGPYERMQRAVKEAAGHRQPIRLMPVDGRG
jgi:hypothetical protein